MFVEWCIANGWRGDLTIDRIDNDRGYEPSNCRFVSKSQNSKNQMEWRRTRRLGGVVLAALSFGA
jgi:hypothetical protein